MLRADVAAELLLRFDGIAHGVEDGCVVDDEARVCASVHDIAHHYWLLRCDGQGKAEFGQVQQGMPFHGEGSVAQSITGEREVIASFGLHDCLRQSGMRFARLVLWQG